MAQTSRAKTSRTKSTPIDPVEPTEPTKITAATTGETDGAKTYVVTEKAPARVAGKRVTAGESIVLTDDQARGELLALHIRPEGVEPKADAPEGSENNGSNEA